MLYQVHHSQVSQTRLLEQRHEYGIERKVSRLIPLTPKHERAVEQVRDRIWTLYERLSEYRDRPNASQRTVLEAEFDHLVGQRTGYPALNDALRLLGAKRDELLAVLEHPPPCRCITTCRRATSASTRGCGK